MNTTIGIIRRVRLPPLVSNLIASLLLALPAPAAERPNILFITVDDLRPQLGCYGVPGMVTPNMDRLAASAVRFDRAYCMVPTCGASRASLMTSVRPTRSRFVTYRARADREAPHAPALNTWFRRAGYATVSLGKVFNEPDDTTDGWTEPPWRSSLPDYALVENRPKEGTGRFGAPFERADVPDEAYHDGDTARRAVAVLRTLARKDVPFLLAVGFTKPHLPFVAPARYWDLYEPAHMRLPDNHRIPDGAPAEAIHTWAELRSYTGIPKEGPMDEAAARRLIHGYHACVSYVDAQVGKVLDELVRLGLDSRTIVVLWGDHGWNLGEHTLWCKHSCFEVSMRVPLLVRAPGVGAAGVRGGLVEMIDLYPTLAELAGLGLPGHAEGRSLVPLLKSDGAAGREAAIGRFQAGDTIRTERYRYTEYTTADGRVAARMLYDHSVDPGENRNIAETEGGRGAVGLLSTLLARGKGRDTR